MFKKKLKEQSERAFPSYFVYLKSYISHFISARLSADEMVVKLKADLPILLRNFKLDSDHDEDAINHPNDHEETINKSSNEANTTTTTTTSTKNDAFLILLSLLLSCVRKVKLAENKFIAVDLMTTFSKFLDDSIVLDRVLPYYLCLLDDTSAPRDCLKTSMVKSHVLYALNDCLSGVANIDVRNMNIFPELIFDCLERASKDESYLVRAAVAKTISSFAITSLRYLEAAHSVRSSYFMVNFGGGGGGSGGGGGGNKNIGIVNQPSVAIADDHIVATPMVTTTAQMGLNPTPLLSTAAAAANIKKSYIDHYSYEREYENYQMRVTEIVMHLITEISQTSSNAANAVKEALIRSDIAKLCTFFRYTNKIEHILFLLFVLNRI